MFEPAPESFDGCAGNPWIFCIMADTPGRIEPVS